MLRSLAIPALVLTTLFALALGALHLQPQQGTIRDDLGDCALPCWKGVQPGVTPAQDAVTHLNTINRFASYEAACEQAHPDRCRRYTWVPPGDQILYTQLEIDSGQVGAVVAYNPGFTLGEALLALNDLQVDLDGADPNFVENNQFYAQVLFAHSHLIVEVVVPCNESYFDLMQTPIRTLEIDSFQFDNHYVPIMTFGGMRRLFYQACAPALQ